MRATARCRRRSSTVGMPKGRVFPWPFGISTRLTGGAWYCPALSRPPNASMRSSRCHSNASTVSPSPPLAPLRLSCRPVSRRKSGVSTCAKEVKQALGACFAFAAIFCSCVDTFILPLCAGDVSAQKNRVLLPRFPMYAAFPRAEYSQGSRLPPWRLPPYGWYFQLAYSTVLVKTTWDLPGSSTLPLRRVPCS